MLIFKISEKYIMLTTEHNWQHFNNYMYLERYLDINKKEKSASKS